MLLFAVLFSAMVENNGGIVEKLNFDSLYGQCDTLLSEEKISSLSDDWSEFLVNSAHSYVFACKPSESDLLYKLYAIHEPTFERGVCKGIFEVSYFLNLEKSNPIFPIDRRFERYGIFSEDSNCRSGEAFFLRDNVGSLSLTLIYNLIFDENSGAISFENCFDVGGKLGWKVKEVSVGNMHMFDVNNENILFRLLNGTGSVICDVEIGKKGRSYRVLRTDTFVD